MSAQFGQPRQMVAFFDAASGRFEIPLGRRYTFRKITLDNVAASNIFIIRLLNGEGGNGGEQHYNTGNPLTANLQGDSMLITGDLHMHEHPRVITHNFTGDRLIFEVQGAGNITLWLTGWP